MTPLNKITASFRGDPNNSKGRDVAKIINAMVDILQANSESSDVNLVLESIGETAQEARLNYEIDKEAAREMAARNQLKLEQALGIKDADGNEIPEKSRYSKFNIVVGFGYFPILGDLLIPAGAGKFHGQGSYIRRKSVMGVLDSVLEYATAFCPVGGSDADGIRTQCGSADIAQFAVVGILKDEGDGGNGFVSGHTPPQPEMVDPSTPMSSQTYWAGQPNTFDQKRFKEPFVYENLTSFTLDNGFGHTEIVVPAKGTFSKPEEVIPDETVDIPLVRYVRAYNGAGEEIARFATTGSKLGGGSYGIFAKNRMCTSRPIVDENYQPDPSESRVYHKPIADDDTTTTVIVPGGLPADTTTVTVSLYNFKSFPTARSQMTPYLNGNYYGYARSSYNSHKNIVVTGMPWNGFMLIDGAYNTFELCMARENGLDGWYNPGGYEDLMHDTFTSCGAVNNGGWGLYLADPMLSSQNGVDHSQWPTADGELKVNRKYTYTASCNNFGNFDTYGNRGGAYFFGGASNTATGMTCEHHFDTHNIDPFGTSARKHLADWNPCRWSSCIVVGPHAFNNNLDFTTTATDTRRNTMCRMRIEFETPAPTNADSNIYSAMSRNHLTHPRPDNFGSLVEVRSKSIHLLHLSPYNEHERAGGDVQSPAQANVGEIQGLFVGAREYLFHPWIFEKSPRENQLPLDWVMRVSAKHDAVKKTANSFAFVADQIGLTDQNVMTHLWYESKPINMKGKTLEHGVPYHTFISLVGFPRNGNPEDVDWENISVTMNYIHHESEKTRPNEDWDGQEPFDESVLITNPRYVIKENAQGTPYIRVEFALLNMTGSDIVFDPDTNARHWFKFAVHAGRVD